MNLRRGLRVSGGCAIFALVLTWSVLGVGYLTGMRLNFTGSLPKGLYWTTDAPVGRGSYVMFCSPPENAFAEAAARRYFSPGHCPGGYRPLLKRVAGVSGDRVAVAQDGVRVNRRLLPWSRPLDADLGQRPLPHLAGKDFLLGPDQLWVMSDTQPYSFDSRYFGPIERGWIRAIVRPVLTWGPGGMFGPPAIDPAVAPLRIFSIR
ncbi:conjugative transfer signal peptidase TraF [Dyella sp. GSA-30]|uniref:conjugative transfer signal peptidase TraF n=1 Tax=Dyella sp. GSA-30 TaxID=2994496 RepID=UPI002492C6BB|nr:conjugative transfer signal peptidase TraF [Dyella sp. GSA-30]BDU23185.1 conjugal transfer protein TraF [Dyella sp. GSA-30]